MASSEMSMRTFLDSELYKRALGFISVLLTVCGVFVMLWVGRIQSDIKGNEEDIIIFRQSFESQINDFIELKSDFRNYKEYNDKNIEEVKLDIKTIDKKLDILIERTSK